MTRLFGTDGVRGVANEALDSMLAYKLGKAGAFVLSKMADHDARIIVGKDTRISGDMLEAGLVAGICSTGAQAICVGVLPTPAIAFLARELNADAGIVISASHNPYEYNGIKFFDSRGFKLPDDVEDEIEKYTKEENIPGIPKPKGEQVGRRLLMSEAADIYKNHVRQTIGGRLDKLKIVIDCANGAAETVAPDVFASLGADITVINNNSNGTNINRRCGSTHMSGLQKAVIAAGADIGIAFDGDADRMLAIDEKGGMVDGDVIMAILANDMKKNGRLASDTIVVTVMSNIGLDKFSRSAGIRLVKSKVGDRYVLEEMLANGYNIGGEQSGHVILLDHNTTGDGLVAALQLTSLMVRNGARLSDLAKIVTVYPQVIVNAHVDNQKKNKYMESQDIADACRKLEEEFAGDGRVLIRPSGTEPMIRIMIEGKDREYIEAKAKALAELIEAKLA